MKKVQLVVTHHDNVVHYHPVGAPGGWKVDSSTRCIVAGKGMPRTYIPLDTVREWVVDEYEVQNPEEEF